MHKILRLPLKQQGNTMGECPICAAQVHVSTGTIPGELLVCDDCGAELEVIETDPVELAEAPSAEEDWGQ
ncbi:MAG TPA: lysine biosynthesis protein LysW [Gammaproteobacteria bacterium]|jgi:alpha-aminoadipate carrier protein LysW